MTQTHLIALCYLALDWMVRVAFVFLVPAGRLPSAARSWILFAIILPIPALLLFLLIGNVREPGWRKTRFNEFHKLVEEKTGITATPEINKDRVERLVQCLGGFPPSTATEVCLLAEYDAFVDRLVAEIDNASRTVHLLTYIFAIDPTGRKIIDALNRASDRGVTCRVLFDAIGSRPWRKQLESELINAKAGSRAISPATVTIRGFSRYDLRNHRKLYVVDGRVGFLGSQNLVASNFRKGVVNRELMVALAGAVVADLELQFARDWYLETGEDIVHPAPDRTAGPIPVHLLPSGPEFGIEGFPLLLVELIYAAQTRITITSPYLVPDEVLLSALRAATAKRVEVHIFVSERIDQLAVGLAQRSYYTELMQMGIRLFAYQNELLHAKHIIIDRRLIYIGSGNADIRSFKLNSEIGLVVTDAQCLAQAGRIADIYYERSTEITTHLWEARPCLQKLGENVFRLASPLL